MEVSLLSLAKMSQHLNTTDTHCLFLGWTVNSDLKAFTTSKGVKKISFSATSSKPTKDGVWNKAYFSSFGKIAEEIEKEIKKGSKIDIAAEQQVYLGKSGDIGVSYLIKEFIPCKKEEDTTTENTESSSQNNINKGYEDMMSFMS